MKKHIFLLFIFSTINQLSNAQNPILRDTGSEFLYTAFPSAKVYNDKVYVYCSRNQPDATSYGTMEDYVVLETEDMVNWVNRGVVLKPRKYAWADGQMNAADVAYKDGWYYFYFPYNKTHIGVAKSRNPEGPWEAAVTNKITTIFDPTVFVDDDGQAYIYGNDHKEDIGEPGTYIMGAKLKDNMTELDGDWVRLSEKVVKEGTHVFKRNGIYYFHASVGKNTEYWMSDSPLPKYATFKGVLAGNSPDSPNHASVIEYKGEWYFFYQRGDVNNGSFFRQSTCFEKMTFNTDGTIQPIVYTLDPNYKAKPVKVTGK